MKTWYSLSFFLLAACSQSNSPSSEDLWQEIAGRDEPEQTQRFPTYRARVPSLWERSDPQESESLMDTRKALCTFIIREGEEEVRVVVHNFPYGPEEQRIPPGAQVSRWKGQLSALDPARTLITPQAHGGYAGFFLEAQGFQEGHPIAMLGWAMQLDPQHFHVLQKQDKDPNHKQKGADYTIKAMGSPILIQKYKEEIASFADSFELIDEIPPPL